MSKQNNIILATFFPDYSDDHTTFSSNIHKNDYKSNPPNAWSGGISSVTE